MRSAIGFHRALVAALMAYLLLPLAVTTLYSIAGDWQSTLLPTTWTLEWYRTMFTDPAFFEALWNSFYLCLATVLLSLAVMLPTVFIVTVYFPRWEGALKAIVILPYAVPGIVAAVGLIKAYSTGPFQALSGTALLLIGAYFVAILPYMYQGLRNSMLTIRAEELIDAAELLGARKATAFRTVILPNIAPGVLVSMLLSFSVLFGEFALTNLLVGAHIETIQMYLYKRLNQSGHLSSAISITYFVFILIVSMALMRLGKLGKGRTSG